MSFQITPEQFAAKLGCTVDQVKAQSAANAIELGEMAHRSVPQHCLASIFTDA